MQGQCSNAHRIVLAWDGGTSQGVVQAFTAGAGGGHQGQDDGWDVRGTCAKAAAGSSQRLLNDFDHHVCNTIQPLLIRGMHAGRLQQARELRGTAVAACVPNVGDLLAGVQGVGHCGNRARQVELKDCGGVLQASGLHAA